MVVIIDTNNLEQVSEADLFNSGVDYMVRHHNLKTETDERLESLDQKMTALRTELSKRLAEGKTTGDHITDLVIRQHGFNNLHELVAAYKTFEKRLAGHEGELVIIPYKHYISSDDSQRGHHHEPQHWRLGVLRSPNLVWAELGVRSQGISIDVSEYIWSGPPVVKENIFWARYGNENPGPSALGMYILSQMDSIPWPSSVRRPNIDLIAIGDAEVEEWRKKRENARLLIGLHDGPFKRSTEALGKLSHKLPIDDFKLEPMGPDDGPTPTQGRDPIGW